MTLSPLRLNPADSLPTQTMTSLAEPVLQTAVLGIAVVPLIIDVVFGILGLIVILIFHGTCINYITMRFDQKTDENLKSQQYFCSRSAMAIVLEVTERLISNLTMQIITFGLMRCSSTFLVNANSL